MRAAAIAVVVLALYTVPVLGQIPDQFILHQNDPNPFCPLDVPGGTTIMFEMAQAAYVVLEVLTPDTLGVERVLIEGYRPAGLHAVMWDGRDDAGSPVGDGVYPYVFTVTDSAGGTLLFEDVLLASASCATPAEADSWGSIKSRFRGENAPTPN